VQQPLAACVHYHSNIWKWPDLLHGVPETPRHGAPAEGMERALGFHATYNTSVNNLHISLLFVFPSGERISS
jgi:hypothetical protein